MHQRNTGAHSELCAGTDNHWKRMLGRTHQPCRERRNNKIVLEEISFELGEQNKEFF